MIRFVVTFFLLFIISLYGADDFELLKRADGYAKSSTKANQFRAYNDYKNIYLRALMNEDQKLKICALEGIVKCGTKLHIDVSQYSDELEKLQKESSTVKKQKKIKQKQSSDIRVSSSHKLKSIRWRDGRLVLSFDKKLRNNQINYFKLYDTKKKVYKYVFDIHASMLTKSQTLKKQNIDKIKLAQFNPTTLRLVIQDSAQVSISFKKENKQLIVNMVPKAGKKYSQTPEAKSVVSPKRLDRNKRIVIDAGHGGKDPGAIGYKGYREKVVVLQIAKELNSILKARGYTVFMTRDDDKFIRLRNRTKYANRKKADLFISIHANAVSKKQAHKAYGIECYFLDKSRSSRAKKVAAQENSADMSEMDFYGKQSFLSTLNSHNIVASNKLAIDLQRGTLASLRKKYKNVKDAGVRPAPFWVLVGAQMPSVLVEVGFITNPKEAKRLVDRQYQKRMALGLANGVERYFLNN
ncbi:N-acetylmuramoyl-L-alanine amidase family protein [Sulfurimonas microaerophilic]|uniref:N-acetylmuramoyl-L-alanine amidase family protein n=1 Tax=Sulfurimonas microaerophilic TaxID=3058392 RepID=UPI002714B4BE|nr:N-acetylmuramoyl-L-alanine amidase [Sulfurimonas sp. hsl 1-7]